MDYRQIPAIFVADAPGLDFLNSVATPVDEEVDWISDGEGLLAWLEQAELVPGAALEEIRIRSTAAELDDVAARARDLREWFRGFVRKRKGRPLVAKDLREIEPLNQLLERDQQHGEIVTNTSGGVTSFELRANRRWQSAAARRWCSMAICGNRAKVAAHRKRLREQESR